MHREAAVGAQPGVVLDAAVEEFYQGPEIGLIRVKEVREFHGGFKHQTWGICQERLTSN
jgi:hypothetical protein